MFGRFAPGPRPAALLVGLLIAVGVVAAAPAGGASGDADIVRVVVQLGDAPLAKYRDTIPGLQGRQGSTDGQGPRRRQGARRAARTSRTSARSTRLRGPAPAVAPDASVQWRYDTAFNGMTVQVSRDRIDAIRRLPDVVSVTETVELEPELDESRALIGLQTLWQSLPSSPLGAGSGLRLALIDSGVNALHPFFNAAGFTAPAGYPKAQRVAGGVRTDLPLATYASNKVIVANVYPTPATRPRPRGAPARCTATHVGGIMAGSDGTYNYTSGPATFALPFSGMAPGAYLMSYRLDGDTAEFIAAIEDVVADEADALNISLGHSRWLTTDPANDPIRDGARRRRGRGRHRRRVVGQRRHERRHQRHRLLEAEPEGDHGREQHARACVLEPRQRHRPGHRAGLSEQPSRGGCRAAGAAGGGDDRGRIRRRTRRRGRAGRRGLHARSRRAA